MRATVIEMSHPEVGFAITWSPQGLKKGEYTATVSWDVGPFGKPTVTKKFTPLGPK
jgi:hypothetical protein